jgi:hypothetical protein
MLRRFLILAGLCAAGLLAGCKGASQPHVHALRATSLQHDWLADLATPALAGTRAQRLRRLLRERALASGAQIVSLRVFTPSSPALTIAVADPARYLKHSLRPVVAVIGARPAYLRIVDAHGKPVLEWYQTGTHGALSVRPGLEGCSPIVAVGWWHVPPCPAR